tara:strand:- start:3600 stop:4283 length:684 start_codon:yes stop_codon:yes gene_type:complete
MIISFSGLDGAGKSTQISIISRFITSNYNSRPLYLWARAGYTPIFSLLKSFIRYILPNVLPAPGPSVARTNTMKSPIITYVWIRIAILDLILTWCFYARIFSFLGFTVICDRYLLDSKLDLQNNFPHADFETYLLWKLLTYLLPHPNISFCLTIPVDLALQRSLLKKEPFPDSYQVLQWRLDSYQSPSAFPPKVYPNHHSLDCSQPLDIVSSLLIDTIKLSNQRNEA